MGQKKCRECSGKSYENFGENKKPVKCYKCNGKGRVSSGLPKKEK